MSLKEHPPEAYEAMEWLASLPPGQDHGPAPPHLVDWVAYCQAERLAEAGVGLAMFRLSGLGRLALKLRPITRRRFACPGWTPLFLRASALVMEVGGYLSHGAIVAREYGIAAVSNLPGVLDAMRGGRRLIVNGEAGFIHRDGEAS
jgi:pyruvate,water dikinase